MRLKHVLHRYKREEELPEAELSKGLVSCSLPSWFKINQKLPVICQKARSTGIWYQKKKKKKKRRKSEEKKEKEVKQRNRTRTSERAYQEVLAPHLIKCDFKSKQFIVLIPHNIICIPKLNFSFQIL